MNIVIKTLGQDQVLVGGKAVHWPSRAARDLFYMLLVSPRGYTKTEITETLWGDSVHPEGNSNFKVTQFRVRQALGDQNATQEYGGRYTLAPAYYEASDHVEFQAELLKMKSAPGREARLKHAYAALSLYAGDFLPDHPTDWAEETRNTLRAASVRVRLEVAQTHCSGVECHAAVRSLAGALATDPLTSEGYHQNLMTCLCTLHRSDDALAHYRHFLTFIQREIGDTPTQETVRLANQIRNAEPHRSLHIGAQTPCPRRTLYGDAYVDHSPQPKLEPALLRAALDRGEQMLELLQKLNTAHDEATLSALVSAALSELLGLRYAGLFIRPEVVAVTSEEAPEPEIIPAQPDWPSGLTEALTLTFRPLLRGEPALSAGREAPHPRRVLTQEVGRGPAVPQTWLWAAWEDPAAPSSPVFDLLGGVADVLATVLMHPRWASLNARLQDTTDL